MSCIFVWYPAFVVAFHLGSWLKSGCRFGHQWFLHELCLPAKTRPETSAVPGRKTLWRLLSGPCTSSLTLCVCACVHACVRVRPMRRKAPYLRHCVGLRSWHQRGTGWERQKRDIAHCPPGPLCTGKHSWSHKNVLAHRWRSSGQRTRRNRGCSRHKSQPRNNTNLIFHPASLL